MNKSSKSYLLTALVIFFWATSATAFKIALTYVSPYNLLSYSSLFSTFIFFSILVLQKKLPALKDYNRKDFLQIALLGFLNPFGYYIVLFKAYYLLPGPIAMSLNYSWPVVLSLLSVPLLKHTLTFRQLISILISFAGVVIIATKGEFISLVGLSVPGVVLALASTIIWAVFWLLNAKDRRDPVVKLFLSFCFGVVYVFILSPFLGKLIVPEIKAMFAIAYISLFEMGITFVLWLTALKLASNTAKISNMIFITPFLSLLILNLVLNEELFLSTFLGLVLVISGIILQGLRKRAREEA